MKRRSRLRVTITDRLGRRLAHPGLGRWLARVAPTGASGRVTVALVSDARMRVLNRRFRGVDRVTDVLSFQMDAPVRSPNTGRGRSAARGTIDDTRHLGDIVIATGRAVRQAHEAGHSGETELRVLALHGLLHLLGYDHARDAGRMVRAERRCHRLGGLPMGLLERMMKGSFARSSPTSR